MKNWQRTPIGRLAKEFYPHRGQVLAVLMLGILVSSVQPASVHLSQKIIDQIKNGFTSEFYRQVPLLLVLIFTVNGFAKYFRETIRRKLTERVLLKIRLSLFLKYLDLPLSVLDSRRTGEMLSNVQNDLSQIGQGIDTFCDILKEPFTILGLVGVALYCDWRLTLCTLIVAPLVAYLFSKTGAYVKEYSKQNMEQFSDLMSVIQESLTGARIIKVFRLEGILKEKFHSIHESYFATSVRSIRVQELATPLVEFIGAVLMAGVIVYGGYRASQGQMTAGQLVAFIVAIGLIQMPIKQLNNAFLKIKAAEAAAERIYAVLDTPEFEIKKMGSKRIFSVEHSIQFEKVALWYNDRCALKDISFSLDAGKCMALVGPSGSGKTSIVNLLPRLYNVTQGKILIDGCDTRDFFLNDLRDLISFVTQDVFLFHDTLYENIRFGLPHATHQQIENAADLAYCTDFIKKLPRGYKTLLGERGVCLSGGERQRVAIARAILKGAPILVLDEATSSLDSHSEIIVQKAIDKLMTGKTTFLIAHRFSTLRRAEKILVLEQGTIVEQGTHQELFKNGGIYTSLFEKQQLLTPIMNPIASSEVTS